MLTKNCSIKNFSGMRSRYIGIKALRKILKIYQKSTGAKLFAQTFANKTNQTMARNQAILDWTRKSDISFCLIFDH